MLPLNVTLSYYKRRDIQEAIVACVQDREIAVKYTEFFGKRPDILSNPSDILELAKQKATSFHCSEERWKNPLQLNPNLKRHELDSIRLGWDLVIDIDCGIFEYSRIAADLVIKAFRFYDIQAISCKFSGNKGFHIAIPFEAFPDMIQGRKTSDLFPEAAKDIALYLREMIKKPLGREIMKFENDDFSAIMKKTEMDAKKITYTEVDEFGSQNVFLNAEPFLNIDTILISSRHLFRAPYSLHEKSGLASLPIDPSKVMQFERMHASPEKIQVYEHIFLDRTKAKPAEAAALLSQALDFSVKQERPATAKRLLSMEVLQEALPEQFFPPCIQLLSNGVSDGRKRALFILINFLSSVGWNHEKIDEFIHTWNKKNTEALRETYVVGQLRYHQTQNKVMPPPNCDNKMYYVDLHVCHPDNLCQKIKNPASYATRKAFFYQKDMKKENELKAKREEKELLKQRKEAARKEKKGSGKVAGENVDKENSAQE